MIADLLLALFISHFTEAVSCSFVAKADHFLPGCRNVATVFISWWFFLLDASICFAVASSAPLLALCLRAAVIPAAEAWLLNLWLPSLVSVHSGSPLESLLLHDLRNLSVFFIR